MLLGGPLRTTATRAYRGLTEMMIDEYSGEIKLWYMGKNTQDLLSLIKDTGGWLQETHGAIEVPITR
jgi:hypothetical protein